jgi:hypothetical protein
MQMKIFVFITGQKFTRQPRGSVMLQIAINLSCTEKSRTNKDTMNIEFENKLSFYELVESQKIIIIIIIIIAQM